MPSSSAASTHRRSLIFGTGEFFLSEREPGESIDAMKEKIRRSLKPRACSKIRTASPDTEDTDTPYDAFSEIDAQYSEFPELWRHDLRTVSLYEQIYGSNSTTNTHPLPEKIAELGNKGMDYLFIACNAFNLIAAIITLSCSGNPLNLLDIIQDGVNSAWNYGDGLGGFSNACSQFQYKEYVQASLNTIASTQLIILTALANASKNIGLSASIGAAFSGFSFAGCMLASFLIECYEVHQCDTRIETLEKAIVDLKNQKNTPEQYTSKEKRLKDALTLERAKRNDHIRSAKSWAMCTAIMTGIALIGFFAASGASAGIVPALIIATTALGIGIGLARKYWVESKSEVLKITFAQQNKLDARLKSLGESQKLDSQKIEKLKLVIQSNPQKAMAVIEYVENLNADTSVSEAIIETILAKHRYPRCCLFSSKPTTSLQIWNQEESISCNAS